MRRRVLIALAFLAAAALFVRCSEDRPVEPTARPEPTETQAARAAGAQDQYIVVFRDDAPSPVQLAGQLAAAHGLTLRHTYQYSIKGFSAVIPAGRLAALQRHPLVKYVEPNAVIHLHRPIQPSARRSNGAAVGEFADVAIPPAAPSNVVATALSSTQIDLTWQDNSTNEKGFEIWRSTTGPGGNFTKVTRTKANTTSYSDDGLDPGLEHCYKVRATAGRDQSDFSNVSCATTDAGGQPPPAAPRKLAATTMDYEQIDLAWQDKSDNEDGFEIQRHDGDGLFTTVAQTGPNVTSFSDVPLQGSTTYTYEVRSFNAGGSSRWSNESSATTDAAPPAAPTSLVATTVSDQRIDLSWADNSSDESGSRIERKLGDQTSTDPFVEIATVGANVIQYFDTGLQASTDYTYRVRAFNGNGNSAYSNESSATTDPAPTPPAPPSGLTASTVSDQRIDLSWVDNSSDESGFRIERKLGDQTSTDPFVEIATVGANVIQYFNTGLQANTSYTYRVRAFNAVGNSAYSNESTATTDPAPTPPAAPSALTATTVDHQQINLSWTDNSTDESGFRIERKLGDQTSTDPFVEIATVGANVVNYFDTGLQANTTYTYRVRAFNTAGNSAYSNDATASTAAPPPPPEPPAAPTSLTATTVSDQRIDLGWTDNSIDESGFRIERKLGDQTSTNPFVEIATVGANVIQYFDTGLQASTDYTYRVRAFNGNGNSEYTNEATATTSAAPTAPAAPTSLTATTMSEQRIDISWTDNSTDESGFRIERKLGDQTSTDPFVEIATVGANVVNYFDTGLEASTTYTYRIRAFNAGGNSAYSNEASATTAAAPTAPPAPSTLTATTVSDQRIDLSWTDNSADESGFKVERKLGDQTSTDPFVEIATVGANVVNYFDAGLQANTTYTYRVRAFNAAGNSSYSNEATATTDPAPAPPAAPTALAATTVDEQGIDLSWTDNSVNEDGFKVERKLGPETSADPFAEIALVGTDVTSFGDTGLNPETEYCYRVRAFNAFGDSDFTSVGCATTAAAPLPPPPGACSDTGNHDPLAGVHDLWNISKVKADLNAKWQATQQAGCEITVHLYGLDSGVDSDHPDLNVVEIQNFVASEPAATGEDGNGHGTHTVGTAAAIDGNGGVVGVAPGAPIHGFRVCNDAGNCSIDDIIAGIDEVTARKLADPGQPIVGNMSLGGGANNALDAAVRRSINTGVVYAISAGNGLLGACLFPNDAQNVSPARTGDDDINAADGSNGDTRRVNGVLTTTSSDQNDQDVNCNFGNPVTVAAPGEGITSTWLAGGYNTIGGTSMAAPHAAGAALIYLQDHRNATPAAVEQAILGVLEQFFTNDTPNADGRLNVQPL